MSVATSAEKKENLLSRIFKKLSHLPRVPLIIGSSLFLVILVSCVSFYLLKGKIPSKKTVTSSITGYIQKGPFISGSQITIQELDSKLNPTGKSFSTTTSDDLGHYSLVGTFNSQYVEVIATGFYFDENAGRLSSSPLTLRAIKDLSANEEKININVLTTLAFERIKYLLINQKNTFTDAQKSTEQEILTIFNLYESGTEHFESMNITKDGVSHAKLVAISAILQGNSPVSDLSELLSKISLDIKEDGKVDTASYVQTLQSHAKNIQMSTIQNNLNNRYKQLGLNVSIPAFDQYVKKLITFYITGVSPSNNAKEVNKNAVIKVSFSKEVVPSTLNPGITVTFNDQPVEGTIEYDSVNWSATFTPSKELSLSPSRETKSLNTYTIKLSTGITSADNEALKEEASYTFSTKRLTHLEVTEVSPNNNSKDREISGKITVNFNKGINKSAFKTEYFTLKNGTENVAGTISWTDASNMTFTYKSHLSALTTYTATLSPDIQAIDTSNLDSNYSWEFTTANVQIEKDLLIYYPFNGDAKDASGHGNDATIIGGATLTQDRQGHNNSAYSLEQNQYFEVPAVKDLWEAPWTVSLWIKNRSSSNEAYVFTYAEPELLKNNESWSANPKFSAYLKLFNNHLVAEDAEKDKNNNWQCWYGSTNNEPYSYNNKNWNQVAVVSDTTGVKMYINGKLVPINGYGGETTMKFTIPHEANKYFLSNPKIKSTNYGTEYYFVGNLDEFRLYNRALNEYEVQELYKQ